MFFNFQFVLVLFLSISAFAGDHAYRDSGRETVPEFLTEPGGTRAFVLKGSDGKFQEMVFFTGFFNRTVSNQAKHHLLGQIRDRLKKNPDDKEYQRLESLLEDQLEERGLFMKLLGLRFQRSKNERELEVSIVGDISESVAPVKINKRDFMAGKEITLEFSENKGDKFLSADTYVKMKFSLQRDGSLKVSSVEMTIKPKVGGISAAKDTQVIRNLSGTLGEVDRRYTPSQIEGK